MNRASLKTYGAFLALCHLLTGFYWLSSDVPKMLGASEAICWESFSQCAPFHELSPTAWQWIVLSFCALSIADALLYFSRFNRCAYFLQIALNIFRIAFVMLDYRLRLNHHIFLTSAEVVFLFLPNKVLNLKVLLVLFYLTASWIKLSADWLSGAVFPMEISIVSPKLLEWLMAYVVLLEAVLVFGVFSRRPLIFWSTLFQLALFHLISVPVVGLYYPALMLFLLSIFVLDRNTIDRPSGSTWAMAIAFVGLQILPKFDAIDSALTGRGRLYSVHMFDANVQCEHTVIYRFKNHSVEDQLQIDYAPFRIHCDPSTFLMKARQRCNRFKGNANFVGISLSVSARRKTDSRYQEVLSIDHVCNEEMDSR